MQFVQQSSPSTIACVFDVDGASAALDAPPTLTVTNSDGVDLIADATATEAEGAYTYLLLPSHTAALDLLTATWVGEHDGNDVEITTYVEVVGQRLFSVDQARRREALQDVGEFPDVEMRIAHDLTLEALQDACGVSFVPRRSRIRIDGSGQTGLILPKPLAREVTWIAINGTALTVEELEEVKTYDSGVLRRSSVWPCGLQNIEVDFVHGHSSPPARIAQAALRLAEHWLIETSIPDRATVLNTDQGSFALVTAGVRGAEFDIPEVNATVRAYAWKELGIG